MCIVVFIQNHVAVHTNIAVTIHCIEVPGAAIPISVSEIDINIVNIGNVRITVGIDIYSSILAAILTGIHSLDLPAAAVPICVFQMACIQGQIVVVGDMRIVISVQSQTDAAADITGCVHNFNLPAASIPIGVFNIIISVVRIGDVFVPHGIEYKICIPTY